MGTMRAVSRLLEQSAARWPDKEAVVVDGTAWSYAELLGMVRRVAGGLADRGVQAGSHVAIMGANSVELIVSQSACNWLGAVAVMMSYRWGAREVQAILEGTAPAVVLGDEHLVQLADRVPWCQPGASNAGEVYVWSSPAAAATPPSTWQEWAELDLDGVAVDGAAEVSDRAPSLMQFTSGTTGLPKAVELSREAEWINTVLMVAEFGFRHDDRTLHVAPLFHAAPWGCFFLPHLAAGATNVLVRSFDPRATLQAIETAAITNLLLVPTHAEVMARTPMPQWREHPALRFVTLTGARAGWPTVKWIKDHLCPRVSNFYGLTEAGTVITYCQPEEMWRMEATETSCIGRPLLGVEVRLVSLDSEQSPPDECVPAGQLGQLICRTPRTMTGYYGQMDKTREKLRGEWLYTGDIAFRDADGMLYIVDRLDDLILSGAENIYPSEIEAALADHPAVADCAVVGLEDQQWGQRVVVAVVGAESSRPAPTLEDIRAWVTDHHGLASYKAPKQLFLVDTVPRTASGKIRRRELAGQLAARAAS